MHFLTTDLGILGGRETPSFLKRLCSVNAGAAAAAEIPEAGSTARWGLCYMRWLLLCEHSVPTTLLIQGPQSAEGRKAKRAETDAPTYFQTPPPTLPHINKGKKSKHLRLPFPFRF